MGKLQFGGTTSAVEEAPKRKKRKFNQEDPSAPLDTGLSLAEDEALVMHLLNCRS